MNNNSVLTEQIKNTLSISYDDITDFSINHNFNLWLKNKEYVKGILSQSSDWDESRLCVHKKISYQVHNDDYNLLYSTLIEYLRNRTELDYWIVERIVRGMILKEPLKKEVMIVACFLSCLNNSDIIDKGIFKIPSYDSNVEVDFSAWKEGDCNVFAAWLGKTLHIKNEIKLSRITQKIIDIIVKDGYEISNKIIADIMDSLIDKTYATALIISIHPCDYLTQSHGKNWTSCHSLRNQGCYHAGIMSMMCDSTSIIIYTLKLDEYYACLERGNQFYLQDKVKRMSAFLNKGVLVFNPLYPDRQNGDHQSPLKSAIVDNVLSILGCQDWDSIDRNDIHFNDHDYWGYDDYKCCPDVIAYANGGQYYGQYNIKIGEEALLVNAENESDTIERNETLGEDGRVYCECCGERCSDDEIYYVNNYGYVCQHCLDYDGDFYMCHGDWEYYNNNNDEKIVIDGDDYRLYYADCHLDYFEDATTGECFTFNGDYYEIYSDDGDHYYFKDSRDYDNYIEEEVLRNTEVYSEYIHEFNLLEEDE